MVQPLVRGGVRKWTDFEDPGVEGSFERVKALGLGSWGSNKVGGGHFLWNVSGGVLVFILALLPVTHAATLQSRLARLARLCAIRGYLAHKKRLPLGPYSGTMPGAL